MSGDSDVYATDGEKTETSLFAAVRYISHLDRNIGIFHTLIGISNKNTNHK